MPFAIGVDVGGTRIKAGVVDEQGRVHARRTLDTQADRGPDAVLDRIAGLVGELSREAKSAPAGVGIGVPGAVDAPRGIVRAPPNLPGWDEVFLGPRIAEMSRLPAFVDNDANAAALGEQRGGAGRGVSDMVMITLGTGVGGGIVLGGKLFRGWFGTAGELGHTIIEPGGRACGCGQRGCLEAYASAANIARQVVESIRAGEPSRCADALAQRGALDAKDVAAAAAAGDALAARIWDNACRYLAVACVNVQHMLNPRRIVLAGGLIAAGAQLLDPIRRHFQDMTWPAVDDKPEIRLAELGDDAGLVGAASLVWTK